MEKNTLFSGLIGQSAVFLRTLNQMQALAQSHTYVLITGETGTGKEKCAQALHALSPRRNNPFIALNCSALPAPLLESELFGHVKGAFTSAHKTHDGLVGAAEGGTLFLDEIGDLDIALQAKLLRFLETGEYRKIGASTTERANVRIVSATHRDLSLMTEQNLFRRDLYFRLAVLTLHLPPLRERQEDIAPLSSFFLRKISAAENKSFTDIDGPALHLLASQPWPGNIRELHNVLARAVILNSGDILTSGMIAPHLHRSPAEGGAVRPLRDMARETIDHAIRLCDGNIPKAAALLEVSPSTLYRRRDNASGLCGI